MLQPNTLAHFETFTMLAVCILGMGFMVRFFIALTGEQGKMRVVHQVRPKRVHSGPAVVYEAPLGGGAGVNPASPLAMGLVRIATALASSPRENRQAALERPRPIAFGARAWASKPGAERSYRCG